VLFYSEDLSCLTFNSGRVMMESGGEYVWFAVCGEMCAKMRGTNPYKLKRVMMCDECWSSRIHDDGLAGAFISGWI